MFVKYLLILKISCIFGALNFACAQDGVGAITGNHAISTEDLGWSVVQVNPAEFGVFILPLGTGQFSISIDDGAFISLNNLTWIGEQVFPKCSVVTTIGDGDISVSLNSFAPLSPFLTLQGFFPVLISNFRFETTNRPHTVEIEYSSTCSGSVTACIGMNPPKLSSSSSSSSAAFNSSNDVFLGASGGDLIVVDCSATRNGLSVAHPPSLNFTLIATDMAAQGSDCLFNGWGPGNSLAACELGCAEDPKCNTINFNAHSGDCVYRICSNPASPNVSSAPGFNVYSTTNSKGPFPQLCVRVTTVVSPGNTSVADVIFGYRDQNGKYNVTYPDVSSFFFSMVEGAKSLSAQHSAFVASIPLTGDSATDQSIRWFLAPPILLTKGVGMLTSTMGYVEMCPRDGYWTTWLHSFMWPGLEADMILEFASFQCDSSIPECGGAENDGKIPTTVLPLIYRDDNIDVTGYFVLRVGRYLNSTGDVSLLIDVYDNVKRALLYLLSRRVGDGLPAAKEDSQWADWLDVDYMVGRKYAPHFCFIFLEAMREGAQFAKLLNLQDDFVLFTDALNQGLAFMTHPISTTHVNQNEEETAGGGMWNATGGFFQDIWWDNRNTNYTLTDNSVGAFFQLIPDSTSQIVFKWLSLNGNEGPFGMRDFYPYFPNADDPPGVYGNGGVYAWLTCIEAVSRMMRGDYSGGERIWKKMSNQMLYAEGQPAKNMAYEYMNGDTGLDMGAFPFGGDGACFMVASLGASQWMRLLDGDIHRLLLRSSMLQPPLFSLSNFSSSSTSLEIIRPLFDNAIEGGGRRLIKMVFAIDDKGTVTTLTASVINDAVWTITEDTDKASHHLWVEDVSYKCDSANEERIDDDYLRGVVGIQFSRMWRSSCTNSQKTQIQLEIFAH
jgi:hypothetical protein